MATREEFLAKLDAYYLPRIQNQINAIETRQQTLETLRAELRASQQIVNNYFNALAEAANAQARLATAQEAIDEIGRLPLNPVPA